MEPTYPTIGIPSPGFADFALTPDAITPTQWHDMWRARSEPNPELRLWWAVLEDAIRCFKSPVQVQSRSSNQSRTTKIQFEAEIWFNSDSTLPGSFIWVCNVLGWDPDVTRQGVMAMAEGRIARRRPNVRIYSQLADTGRRHQAHHSSD